MKALVRILLFSALLFCGWYLASPWLAMKGIVDAARDGDEAALEERIDFVQLRAGANSQIADAIEERTREGGVLARIGGAVAEEIAESAVDAAFTPRGIVNLVTVGSFAAPLVPERFRGQQLEWDVARTGFDTFEGVSTWKDGSEGPVMIFERDGLGWELVGVELAEWN